MGPLLHEHISIFIIGPYVYYTRIMCEQCTVEYVVFKNPQSAFWV